MRKELTITLEESLIDEMVEIAESRNLTLSTIFGDILKLYCESLKNGYDFMSHAKLSAIPDVSGSDSLVNIVNKHDLEIKDLLMRVARIENSGTMVVPRTVVSNSASVIDTDLTNLTDFINTPAKKEPILPVIDAIEYGGARGIIPDKEYTVTETAAILGISGSTLRKHMKNFKIKARKLGRSWLIYGSEISTYMESRN